MNITLSKEEAVSILSKKLREDGHKLTGKWNIRIVPSDEVVDFEFEIKEG